MASRATLTPGNASAGPSTNRAAFTTIHATEMVDVGKFDPTTGEAFIWDTVVPAGWTGPGYLEIFWGSDGTTNTVGWLVSIHAVTPGDSVDFDTTITYDTANTGTAATVPGTSTYMKSTVVTLTNFNSGAAGDLLRIKAERDVANDTSASDAVFFRAELRDSA